MLLYETLSQPIIFIIALFIGMGSGLIIDLRHYVYFLCNNNKIVGVVLDLIATLLCCFIFFCLVLNFNFGEMRLYLIISFVCGLLIERFSLGLIVAKLSRLCYNKFRKLISRFAHEERNDKKESIVNN